MSGLDALMAQPLIHRLLQAPFAAHKLAPVLAWNDLRGVRRVLDVACGPGTNAPVFAHADYVGVDLNERYVESARRRHRGRFVAADAIRWVTEATEQFDFILANSFLHHLDDGSVRALLANLCARLAPGGTLHILELVLPPSRGVARMLARADRGKYARPLDAWRALFQEAVRLDRFEPYTLSVFGVPLWEMVYGRGSPPR